MSRFAREPYEPDPCAECDQPLAGGSFCPSCGARQSVTRVSAAARDPWVGRMIADRYEVGELISVGGMGRVHRGLQRSLDRKVAIKFIHPELMKHPEVVTRFMTEARAASSLNHPNVVSVYDFGRTAAADGGDLYMVMELLGGSDLQDVLDRDGDLPLGRAVDIVAQTLMALGAAHQRGITHRDVKPENIVLERLCGDRDHVKVIDFGIASVGGARNVTLAGNAMGTPAYMSPEQARGETCGPAADIYGVAVVLYRLLTGAVPFADDAPLRVLQMQVSAPRPDPRRVAPHRCIPDGLAHACMRAMSIDPAARFPDAQSFLQALTSAPDRRSRVPDVSSSPPATTSRPPPVASLPPAAASSAPPAPASSGVRLHRVPSRLFGREQEVGWARAMLDRPGAQRSLSFWGRPGVGCSALMDHVAALEAQRGATVVRIGADVAPRSEIGFSGLRALISALGKRSEDPTPTAGKRARDPLVTLGLRIVFGGDSVVLPDDPATCRTATAALLAWSLQRVHAGTDGRLVIAIDDVDRIDGSSLQALAAVLRAGLPADVVVLMTSQSAPDPALAGAVAATQVRGLPVSSAAMHAASLSMSDWTPDRDDVDPMYVVQRAALLAEAPGEHVPTGLAHLLDARVQTLPLPQRRVLQAMAVLGAATSAQLSTVAGGSVDLTPHIRELESAGFVTSKSGIVRCAHALLRQAALRSATADLLACFHARVVELLSNEGAGVELLAHHALRAGPDIEAFLLCERSAALRSARGDHEGAIAALAAALKVARVQLRNGDVEVATNACAVFTRQIASSLLSIGRAEEAYLVLLETLGLPALRDEARAATLEQLAIVTRKCGLHAEATRAWSESLRIATTAGDHALIERLRGPIPDPHVSPPPTSMFQPIHA